MKQLYRIVFIIGFATIFISIIAYARGYRLDLNKKKVSSTGIISTSSFPKAAKIYVNDQLKGVTDTNITLEPGNYDVNIKKDGYTSYSKKINLKGELVASVDALLFPLNPGLSPLTNLGIAKAILIENTEKAIIIINKEVDNIEKPNGIYIFEYNRTNLPFFPPLKTIILKNNLPENIDITSAVVEISPDLKEAIFTFDQEQTKVSYLLSLDQENITPFNITASSQTLFEAWEKQKSKNEEKILETFPKDFVKIASDSIKIIGFSPSETKILYQADSSFVLPPIITPPLIATNQTQEQRNIEKDSIYVYDKKEDKNYLISDSTNKIQWYFDSKHLAINENKKISIVDYDNTNKRTIYSGPYDTSFFMMTIDGNLVTLTNLNPEANTWGDLYLVGLR